MTDAKPSKRTRRKVAVGDVFGRLTVIEAGDIRLRPSPRQASKGHSGPLAARVQCECGKTLLVVLGNLRSGNTKSCGCLRDELAPEQGRRSMSANWQNPEYRERRSAQLSEEQVARWASDPDWAAKVSASTRTHGLAGHVLYHTHYQMMARCYRPDHVAYKNYGGRGISVHPSWHALTGFTTWMDANLGPRPEGLTLDRINNDGNYEPGNVRWATWSEQQANRRCAVD